MATRLLPLPYEIPFSLEASQFILDRENEAGQARNNEIGEWLEQQCKYDEWDWDFARDPRGGVFRQVIFKFAHKSHAVLFKLAWGGQ